MSDDQPRPRFGEYAPGHTPGRSEPSAPHEGDGSAPAGSVPAPWSSPAPAPGPAYAAGPGYGPGPGFAPPVKKRNTVDLVFTIILLVLGLFGMLAAFGYAAIFSDPQLLDEAMRQQGRSGFSGRIGQAPLILVVSHVVLYLLAVGLSILSLVKRRITFWIPLSIGVIAAVVFWVTVVSVLLSDPSFMQRSGL